MKKLFLLFLICFPALIAAQEMEDYISKIPVYDGKVIFRDTIPVGNVDKDELRSKILASLDVYLKSKPGKTGIVRYNDSVNHILTVQVVENMEIEKKTLSIFMLWSKYTIFIDYSKDDCLVEVRNIIFIEPDEDGNNKRDKRDNYTFKAEYAFIEKKYRIGMVKEPVNKMAHYFIGEMNNLFTTMQSGIK